MFLARSGSIDGYEKLVRELGQNPVQLMSRLGMSPAQFHNPNTYVSYTGLAQLLEDTADACGEPLFGLLLACRQTSNVLGDLPVILSQQETVRNALTDINRYLYLHARGAGLEQRRIGDTLQLELELKISSPDGLNQLIQMSIGQLANFATDMLNVEKFSLPLYLRQAAPKREQADHAAPSYSRVQFSAGVDGVRIPDHWLDRKSHHNEQALHKHFQDYLQGLQQRYPDNLQDQVKEIMGRILPSGECRIERVAATLELHPRVLQKRLKKQQTSYARLLRETRMEIATQHLRHASTGITDLALQLGYADVSVFSRNFKQWSGQSPRQWRQAQQ